MSDCTASLGAIEQQIRETSNSLLRARIAEASTDLAALCIDSGVIHTQFTGQDPRFALTAGDILGLLSTVLYDHYRAGRETLAVNAFMAQVAQVSGPLASSNTPSTQGPK